MARLEEKVLVRAMQIGNEFQAWNQSTGGPCPISCTSGYWFKALCAMFERIAYLEDIVDRAQEEIGQTYTAYEAAVIRGRINAELELSRQHRQTPAQSPLP